MTGNEPSWRKHLTDYDEGLGLVYERFVLNDFLDDLRRRYNLGSVLEAPLYGMAGVSGINSVALARNQVDVTLVDDNSERLAGVRRIWTDDLQLPASFVQVGNFSWRNLPFPDQTFDLCWQWAGLWFLPDPAALVRELIRTSRRLVLLAMPNPLQVGYWTRKHLLDRDFFQHHDERWTHINRLRRILHNQGAVVIDEGVLDVPPWPDTVMPAHEVLARLGIHSSFLQKRFTGDDWSWSTMAYYLGEEPDLRDRVMRHAWLEHLPIPWQIKLIWAHHRYLLAEVP